MQGTWVWSLVQELRPHTLVACLAATTEPDALSPWAMSRVWEPQGKILNDAVKIQRAANETWWSQTHCSFIVQLLNLVQLFVTPWTAARQVSLFFIISQGLLKPMSIKPVTPSNHLILCHSLLLLPSIFPSSRVFSNESAVHIRWPKYWSFSFSISPPNEYSRLISFRTDWFDQTPKKIFFKFLKVLHG